MLPCGSGKTDEKEVERMGVLLEMFSEGRRSKLFRLTLMVQRRHPYLGDQGPPFSRLRSVLADVCQKTARSVDWRAPRREICSVVRHRSPAAVREPIGADAVGERAQSGPAYVRYAWFRRESDTDVNAIDRTLN